MSGVAALTGAKSFFAGKYLMGTLWMFCLSGSLRLHGPGDLAEGLDGSFPLRRA